MTTIARNIFNMREALGLTQQALSRHLDVSLRTIVRWERGQNPGGESLDQLRKFAENRGLPSIAENFPQSFGSFQDRESRRIDPRSVPELHWVVPMAISLANQGYELALYRKGKP